MSRDLQDMERRLEALRRDLGRANAQAAQYEGALSELDERRTETADRLELARRQADEFRQELDRTEADLETARHEAAAAEIEDAAERRDEAARRVASAINSLIAAVDELDGRRAELAQTELELGTSGVRVDVPGEPELYAEAMERLVALVRGMLDDRLEDELLDAAARSSRARAIEELPPHLQEAARIRRRQLAKQRWNA